MLRLGRDGVGCQHFCICQPGRVFFCSSGPVRTSTPPNILAMGRADFTEKSVERNGMGVIYGDLVVGVCVELYDETKTHSKPPLSFAQEHLWFLDQLNPGSSVGRETRDALAQRKTT